MEDTNPHQISYPATNVEITEQGMLITIMFAPSLSMTQAIGADAMNAIVKKWLESRIALAGTSLPIETINHIKKTRNN